MGILDRGMSAHLARLKKASLVTVTLRRGSDFTPDIEAVPATTTVIEEQGDGSASRHQSRDFLIAKSDYCLDGDPVLPEKGDLLEETDGDYLYTFEVLPFAGEGPARFMGQTRDAWRVHCKLIEQAETGVNGLTDNQLRAILGELPYVGQVISDDELGHILGVFSLVGS